MGSDFDAADHREITIFTPTCHYSHAINNKASRLGFYIVINTYKKSRKQFAEWEYNNYVQSYSLTLYGPRYRKSDFGAADNSEITIFTSTCHCSHSINNKAGPLVFIISIYTY